MEQESINNYERMGINLLSQVIEQPENRPSQDLLAEIEYIDTKKFIKRYYLNETQQPYNPENEELTVSSEEIALNGLAMAFGQLRQNARQNNLEENINFVPRTLSKQRQKRIQLRKYELEEFTKFDNIIVFPELQEYNKLLNQKIPKLRRSTAERDSHKFRSARMRSGPFEALMATLQVRPEAKASVSRMVRRAKDLMAGTQSDLELHRAYAPLVAGLLAESETSREFIGALDESAAIDSEELRTEARANGQIESDVVVIGGGVQGAIFSAELRSVSPGSRIVSLDKGARLGGQFRKYGDRPVFYINSRNFRPQNNDAQGLPGKNGNLNSFGEKAPLQLTDFSSETYPTNLELGVVTAVNQYMSAETILGVGVDLDYGVRKRTDGRYEVTSRDVETGEEYTIVAKKVVVATGPGEREQPNRKASGRWTADEVLAHFADADNPFPMDAFAGKTIAIKGGGDTGRVIAELLSRLGPKEAYGKSTVQFGGPKRILWYGTDFENRDEFCDTSRPRYERLASFIIKSRQDKPQDGQIVPFKDKINTDSDRSGLILLEANSGPQFADIVIDATQLTSQALEAFKKFAGTPELIEERLPILGNSTTAIGRKLDSGIYFVGPVANLPLTIIERRSFAMGIKENTIAIWKNQIRSTRMARYVARELAPAA